MDSHLYERHNLKSCHVFSLQCAARHVQLPWLNVQYADRTLLEPLKQMSEGKVIECLVRCNNLRLDRALLGAFSWKQSQNGCCCLWLWSGSPSCHGVETAGSSPYYFMANILCYKSIHVSAYLSIQSKGLSVMYLDSCEYSKHTDTDLVTEGR